MTVFLSGLPIPANIAIFVLLSGIVRFTGARIARYADALGERLGIGEAILGLILLAGVTSPPEIATSLTAASAGDAPLAVNNLLGSIAMQVAVLALADFSIRRAALTSVLPDPVVMLQGALNIGLLAFVAAAALVGDTGVAGAGIWSWLIAAATVGGLAMLSVTHRRPPAWVPGDRHTRDVPETVRTSPHVTADLSTGAIALGTLVAAVAILVAGYGVATVAGVLATYAGGLWVLHALRDSV